MSLPRTLYKYRSFQEDETYTTIDQKYQKKSLTNAEIYFSHPDQFNDPFDLNIKINYDGMGDEERLIHTVFHIGKNNNHSRLSYPELEIEAQNIIKANLKQNASHYAEASLSEIRLFRDRHPVFCLSENPDNILMWAHYANSNKGYCLGYDSQKLFAYLKRNSGLQVFAKVKYASEYPDLKPAMTKERQRDNLITRLLTKSLNWSYEDEWRLILLSTSPLLIKLPKECISEIILGQKIDPKVEEEIRMIHSSKYPHAKLMKVFTSKSEFKFVVNVIIG